MLAARSVAYPVALAGLPPVLIGALGSNPLPRGSVAILVALWAVLAVFFALAGDMLPLPAWTSLPFVISALLGLLLLARLGSSTVAYGTGIDYAGFKLRLFVAGNVVLLLAGILIGRRGRWFDAFVVVTLLVAVASAILLVKQLASGQVNNSIGGRLAISPDENPIFLGRRSAQGLLLASFLTLSARSAGLRLLGLGVIPLLAVSLLASGSRGPLLALVVGLLVLFGVLLRDPSARQRMLLIAGGALIAAIIVPQLVPGQNITRTLSVLFGSQGGLSSNGRFHLWGEAYRTFLHHPVIGIGTGGFARIEPTELYPHNVILEAAAEWGTIGVILVGGFIASGFAVIARVFRRAQGADRQRAALVAALFAASFVNSMLSDSLELASTLWLTTGLAIGLALRGGEQPVGVVEPLIALRKGHVRALVRTSQ